MEKTEIGEQKCPRSCPKLQCPFIGSYLWAETKLFIWGEGLSLNLLRANAGDKAQLLAPNAP